MPGETKERHGLFAYNEVIYQAFLTRHQHALLAYYAVAYNWTGEKASYHSQAQICRTLDMPKATYQSTRDQLESLGWISLEKKYSSPAASHKSVYVTVHCGKDDEKRAAKIQADRVKLAQKDKTKENLLEEAEGFEFRGGRTPEEEEKFRASIAHFEAVEEHLATKPRLKNSVIPLRTQSERVQFQNQNR